MKFNPSSFRHQIWYCIHFIFLYYKETKVKLKSCSRTGKPSIYINTEYKLSSTFDNSIGTWRGPVISLWWIGEFPYSLSPNISIKQVKSPHIYLTKNKWDIWYVRGKTLHLCESSVYAFINILTFYWNREELESSFYLPLMDSVIVFFIYVYWPENTILRIYYCITRHTCDTTFVIRFLITLELLQLISKSIFNS